MGNDGTPWVSTRRGVIQLCAFLFKLLRERLGEGRKRNFRAGANDACRLEYDCLCTTSSRFGAKVEVVGRNVVDGGNGARELVARRGSFFGEWRTMSRGHEWGARRMLSEKGRSFTS